MNQIIFISRTLDPKSIISNEIKSSSGSFEYGLICALNRKIKTSVIHLGTHKETIPTAKIDNYTTIDYPPNLIGFFRLMKEVFKQTANDRTALLTTGYYPLETLAIATVSKIRHLRAFSYIYDTHTQATSKMPRVKRIISNIYFEVGFWIAKHLSGIFVLNDSFVNKRRIKTPYLKTKVGITQYHSEPVPERAPTTKRTNNPPVIIFAGTLNEENGTSLLMGFAARNPAAKFQLHVYGDGDLASDIENVARNDSRIKYFGRIRDSELQIKLKSADYLINLRDPNGASADYSFPSKIINFIASGTPVVSNRFPGLDASFDNVIHVFDEYSESSLSDTLISLLSDEHPKQLISSTEFIALNHNWDIIATDILKAMRS